MKKNNLRGLAVFMLSIALIISIGCEGPEGPTGPDGAQGPQGEVGPEGPQGPAGTANVIFSEWIRLGDVASAADTTLLGRTYSMYHIPAPELTQEIVDDGVAIMYYSLQGMVTPLPYTLAGSPPITVTFAPFGPGHLTVLSQRHDNTIFNLNLNTEFRYILIPGGMPAKATFPDMNDYYAVMEYYGIDP